MMPMFRHFASDTVRATVSLFFLRDEARIDPNLFNQGRSSKSLIPVP